MNNRFRVSGLLAGRLAEHHIPLPDLLRRAGLPADFFQSAKIYATTTQMFALWRTLGELSPDPGLGLKLGNEPRLERYDAPAIAAVCSRSFRDALQRIARYKRLVCPEEVRLRTTPEEASVEFIFLEADEDEPEILVDLCLAWILAIGRRGTDGGLKPIRVELLRPVRSRQLLEDHFGCPVRFNARRNALVFRAADLDRPFVTHNADLAAAVGSQLETELAARDSGQTVGEQVQKALRHSLAGRRPTLQNQAKELGLSARTLQRRLTAARLTFQQLVEDTRRDLAHHYLSSNNVELTEAAYLLGYEDANSFFRAFHLWEGMPPGEWRARRRREPAAKTAGP